MGTTITIPDKLLNTEDFFFSEVPLLKVRPDLKALLDEVPL
jgi:hypothetical protein